MDRENATALAKKLTFDSNKMEFRRYLTNWFDCLLNGGF
jgi:hypothetical protein